MLARNAIAGIAAVLAIAFAGKATADVPEPLDRASLSLGGFYPTISAHLSADGPGLPGTDVDFQHLGLAERQTLANVHLDLLVLDSQGLSIGGYQYSRSVARTLARDIQFQGYDYDTNAFVHAGLRLETYNAAWHWWISPGVADVFGVGLGAIYYDLKGTLDGTITINGGSASGHGEAEGGAVAPLLTLGWRHAFSDRLRAYADFSGVRKIGGALSGHLLDGTLGVEYFAWRNAGFAIEYKANDLDLKADRDSWEGRARIHFQGPALFVRLRF